MKKTLVFLLFFAGMILAGAEGDMIHYTGSSEAEAVHCGMARVIPGKSYHFSCSRSGDDVPDHPTGRQR